MSTKFLQLIFKILDIYDLLISGGVPGCNDIWHGDLIQKKLQTHFVLNAFCGHLVFSKCLNLHKINIFSFFPNLDV